MELHVQKSEGIKYLHPDSSDFMKAHILANESQIKALFVTDFGYIPEDSNTANRSNIVPGFDTPDKWSRLTNKHKPKSQDL